MNWRSIVVGVVAKLGMEILSTLAQYTWDRLWKEIIAAIGNAELIYRQKGCGSFKRDWVMSHAMGFLEDKRVLKWWNRAIVRHALEQIVDYLVGEINKELSKSWTGRVSELERVLAGKLPVIN